MPYLTLEEVAKLREKIKTILSTTIVNTIPLSFLFEALGYSGWTGVSWGILSGFIVGMTEELGFQIKRKGKKYFLERKNNKRGEKT